MVRALYVASACLSEGKWKLWAQRNSPLESLKLKTEPQTRESIDHLLETFKIFPLFKGVIRVILWTAQTNSKTLRTSWKDNRIQFSFSTTFPTNVSFLFQFFPQYFMDNVQRKCSYAVKEINFILRFVQQTNHQFYYAITGVDNWRWMTFEYGFQFLRLQYLSSTNPNTLLIHFYWSKEIQIVFSPQIST